MLRDADIVRVRVDAQRRIYSLSHEGLVEVDEWLQKVRRYWLGRLDKLEQALRDEED